MIFYGFGLVKMVLLKAKKADNMKVLYRII